MPWAVQRQLLFALVILIILGGAGFFLYITFLYIPPSCSDGVQNQDEGGVDCGGACLKLCAAPNVTPLWARAVEAAPGVYHAVSLVRNPDTGAAGTVRYTALLFDEENILIASRNGTLFMTPGEVVPLFVPNIPTGERIPSRTFIDIEPGPWQRAERAESTVRVLDWDFQDEAARLTARVENYGALNVGEVIVTALLYNASGTLIGASQTRFPSLTARERREAIFTWSEPFSEEVVRIDILPRVTPEE